MRLWLSKGKTLFPTTTIFVECAGDWWPGLGQSIKKKTRMALPHMIGQFQFSVLPSTSNGWKLSTGARASFKQSERDANASSSMKEDKFCFCTRKFLKLPSLDNRFRRSVLRASRTTKEVKPDDWKDEEEEMSESDVEEEADLMNEEERREWRKKIREVIDKYSDTQEGIDPEEKRMKMQKLLKDYPLVVDEEDPDWPEDADGRGFGLDQFFNKITIKNAKKDDVDDDSYDSDNEVVWQDDDYIRPIKDITTVDWEETVFKDISPLIILVHNRYKRPKENQRFRDELEKAVNIIWNCRLPSPRCVAIDAVIETDLVSALQVSVFPELIFTKAGKVLYREKAIRTADELSKIMAFFYYGAAKPSFFNHARDSGEVIPFAPSPTQMQ